jgi:hypothetical protein
LRNSAATAAKADTNRACELQNLRRLAKIINST